MREIEAKSKGRVKIDFSGDVFVREQEIIGASYSGLRGGSFTALDCTFEKSDFSNMRLRHMTFASGRVPTKYLECKFDGSRFKKSILGQARFERCSFLNVDIKSLFSHAAEFIDCIFSGTLSASSFYGRVFGGYRDDTTRVLNEFHGNDFSAMKLSDVVFFQGISLSRQRLPVGDNYLYLRDAAKVLALLRGKHLQSAASPYRETVFKFLARAEKQAADGQAELFLCKDSEIESREVIDALWEELRHIPD